MHELIHAIIHSLIILPFLYVAYLLMELLEHKAGEKFKEKLENERTAGPAIGSLLGIVPLCGLADLSAGLYAGKVISLGTLVAIFASTSGETAFLAAAHPEKLLSLIFIFLLKIALACGLGFAIDLVLINKQPDIHIHDLCEDEHCHCEESNVWLAAMRHAVPMFGLVLLVNIIVAVLEALGVLEAIGIMTQNFPALGVIFATIIGLIPGCAPLVLLTSLWFDGIISASALLAGLLTSAGTGYLVLFSTNKNLKQNFIIVGIITGFALLVGGLFEISGLLEALGV
jgi:hypothetical protein